MSGGLGRGWGGASFAKGIGDDAGGVEVGEHFRPKFIDDIRDFSGQPRALFTELDEGVCGGGVEGEDERAKGLEDVHAGFAEAERGEGNGGEEDDAESDDHPKGDPFRH